LSGPYEDLWQDPLRVLREDCRFIGIEGVSDAQLQRVIDSCSFQNMRSMELSATPETSIVPGLYRSGHEHEQAFKVRKGGVGNWTETLPKMLSISMLS
jgi:Sulfotransferase domain